MRNYFGRVIICCWVNLFVRMTLWGQVVGMNFASINFNICWKLLGYPPASWVIYKKDALPMISWSIPYWDTLPTEKIFKIHKHSLKHKIRDEEFTNSS